MICMNATRKSYKNVGEVRKNNLNKNAMSSETKEVATLRTGMLKMLKSLEIRLKMDTDPQKLF